MAHRLQINKDQRGARSTWNPDRLLAEALAERALFLEKYPQYREYQRQIDGMLDRSGSSENRMAVLALLMEAKLIEMHDRLKDLNRLLLALPN
ncbi:MAG: hypothetical protein HZB24_16590 [Desulfobacterales bacterium]|nr:hypothetical protein [Desulfobacterales bacterium]